MSWNEKAEAMTAMVKEMFIAFDHKPSVETSMCLVKEEHTELLEAMALSLTDDTLESFANVLKEACDLYYVVIGALNVLVPMGLKFDLQVLAEIIEPAEAVIEVFGEDVFFAAFSRVHASNMSKLGDDGQPIRREDGKVLKGPNYAPPSLNDLAVSQFLKTQALSPMEFNPA